MEEELAGAVADHFGDADSVTIDNLMALPGGFSRETFVPVAATVLPDWFAGVPGREGGA